MRYTKRPRGLSLGQVLTLTLGFLLASLLIFVFGIWVGKDLVERRLAQEERVVRRTADQTALAPRPNVQPAAELTPAPQLVTERLATPTVAIASPTPTPGQVLVRPTARVPAALPSPTRQPDRRPARSTEEWADAGWTVQVYATTDPQQATELARRLIAKGYEAYTLQAPMRGVTWYRVRVGRFASREQARVTEQQLKRIEGMEAAYVTAR